MDKADIRSFTYEKLCGLMADMGEKRYRADQVFEWLHKRKETSFDNMTNLPKKLRDEICAAYDIYTVRPVKILSSGLDGTRKYLHMLKDGNVIETVLLRYDYGNSVCISSQVGCRMGCRFCASTIDGLERNLTAGEMAGQIYSVEADIKERVGHVVVMGSGEPLDNYDSFTDFIDIITDGRGAGIGGRNITVSTCGIAPNIRRLADRGYAITLALSLHAADDDLRRQIMPIANRYSLREVTDACRYYFDTTGRRITLEYSLIEGVNDRIEDISGLIRIAKELGGHVNLIPVNPIDERDYRSTGAKAVSAIKNKLEKNRINVTIRREMGRDIQGACGQLRRGFIRENVSGETDA